MPASPKPPVLRRGGVAAFCIEWAVTRAGSGTTVEATVESLTFLCPRVSKQSKGAVGLQGLRLGKNWGERFLSSQIIQVSNLLLFSLCLMRRCLWKGRLTKKDWSIGLLSSKARRSLLEQRIVGGICGSAGQSNEIQCGLHLLVVHFLAGPSQRIGLFQAGGLVLCIPMPGSTNGVAYSFGR